MRAGGCTLQQALTAEAASVVKQAVALAKRRGHAQVTPLHVANTMLAASSGLFRTACLQSHSHPLQCKALELCFNVALNRLPASSPSPLLGGTPQHSQQYPAISNALVAAFKRAQAHQRRGSIENQQQPLLAVKIELEQLIISILDDPSVSRVMKEAGFLSTQVKNNVEKAVSSELCFQNPPARNKSKENNLLTLSPSSITNQTGAKFSKPSTSEPIGNDDVSIVVEYLVNRRWKSIVIVGECISSLESTVRQVMNRVDKGGVPESLREVKFISIPLHSFCNLRREVVEQKMGELTCLVKSLVDKGIVLYLGDLKWITDYRVSSWGQERISFYCPVEHMIMEIGRLVCGIGEIGKLWLIGIATFQSFSRCRTGQCSLENIWGLHPLTIPANSLGLSLNSDGEKEIEARKVEYGTRQLLLTDGEEKLSCCADCSAEFETEARGLETNACNADPTRSTLPSWLRNESRKQNINDQDCVSVGELCKKWNAICNSIHKQPKALERNLSYSSASPSPSTCFSFDLENPSLQQIHFPMSRKLFSSNPNSTPNSANSLSDVLDTDYVQKFKEFNAENLNILCNVLEEKVPWQKEIIPEIAGSILQCRSGMLRRKDKIRSNEVKEETWLFFLGLDALAKEKIARELAKIVFGSYSNLVMIPLSRFSCTRTNSNEDHRNKRSRDEQNSSYVDRFAQAVSADPHRVFLVEDLDQADYFSQIGIKRAIEKGRITNENGEEVSICDAIIILSCDSFSTRSRASSPSTKQKSDGSLQEEKEAGEEERFPCVSLDLNIGFDDEDIEEKQSIDELGILEIVDRQIVFKIQEL